MTPNCNCCDCAVTGGVADGDGVGGIGGGGDGVGDGGGGGVGGGGSGGALYMQRLGGGGSVLARAPLGVNGTKWHARGNPMAVPDAIPNGKCQMANTKWQIANGKYQIGMLEGT